MLTRQGYRILESASGAEALQLVREHKEPIDLLLTDVVMPQMSGVELARAVQAARPGIKVLYMSGHTDNSVVDQGFLTNGVAFIQKPFTAAALHTKVRSTLRDG
jgi:CheY-like chemotaxis protein